MKLRSIWLASIGSTALVVSVLIAPVAPAALKSSAITPALKSAAASKSLANPGMILIDPATGETVFESSANSLRKPASLLKILSATALLTYLPPEHRFSTELFTGAEPNTLIIAGSLDPWMERDGVVAIKTGRASLPKLVKSALKKLDADNGGPIKTLRIEYSNMHSADLDFIKAQFQARDVKVSTLKLNEAETLLYAKEPIAKFESPTLQSIMDWMLIWSDNNLGNRLAMQASLKAGFGYTGSGIEKVFIKTLTDLQIDPTGLNAVDGSGLSKSNKVSARMMSQLLHKTYNNEKYRTIYSGLPVGGINGTMRTRFVKSAPAAIGLVRAKTGTLNGTVSLAGYVQAGDQEYIFVVIADQIPRGNTAANAARTALDKMLAKFAKPVIKPTPSPSAVIENLDGTTVTSNPSS
jgi:D-alanyl-D-alanine carboxypeptidase/D-alanyl-D-alanine-endopeptidase (penicillin-binding protein 4)